MFIEKKDGKFVSVYEHEKKLKFIHAIWGAEIDGTPYAFVGNREEDRDLIAIHFDKASGKYVYDTLEKLERNPETQMKYVIVD